MRRVIALTAMAAVACSLVTGLTQSPAAALIHEGQLVSDDPANFTPHVLDGRANAIAQVGNTMILGGEFTQVRAAPDGSPVLSRSNLVAFNATTGAISTTFVPNPNGEVTSLLPAADGTSVYVGGAFTQIAGGAASRVARLNVSNGQPVAGFTPPSMNARVNDIKLVNGRLWLAGLFSRIGGRDQIGLATINATTGAYDPYYAMTLAGTQNGGKTHVAKIDVTPDGTRLVAIGNFRTLNGVDNRQLFMLSLTGPTAAAANWRSSFYTSDCSATFELYVKDVAFSPDGTFFVVTSTGAYRGADSACDLTARFETNASGSGILPTWRNYTGGDTVYALEVTDDVVYVGGHPRWQNNPFAGDQAGPGAISRPGIAALDPINGLPYSWNPTRTRGIGVFDLLATPQGLWVASDTDRIGNFEYHGKIALMPLAGGKTILDNVTPGLPNNVFIASPASAPNGLVRRSYNGTTAGPATTAPSGSIPWGTVVGSFMLNGTLYTGYSNGSFTKQTFDGTTYGPATPVNTSDLLVPLTAWRNELGQMTGLFFDRGRMYFTLSGQTGLFYRYFTPESDVVGASRFTASTGATGINFSQVRGMFLAGNKLYWTQTDGTLRRIDWSGSGPVGGTAATVSGPGIDGVNWAGRALFLSQGAGTGTNQPPVASFTVSCTQLDCSMNANASTDPDGTITSYEWDFGDGGTATGQTTSHHYATPGPRTVTLTVRDSGGLSTSTTRQATPTQAAVSFVAAASNNANRTAHSVQIPGSVQAGDALALFFAGNNTNVSIANPAGWSAVRAIDDDGVVGRLWTKTAGGGDAGSTVTVTASGLIKADLSIAAYRGTGAGPVEVSAVASETVSRAAHTTPTVNVFGGRQLARELLGGQVHRNDGVDDARRSVDADLVHRLGRRPRHCRAERR